MSMSSKTPRRIIALWFPRLPTDRLQRREQVEKTPALEAPPLVLVAKRDNTLRLSAVDRKATALGLTIGQPLANARAMLPDLKVVAANDPADLKLLTQIADWCDRFTPFVALDGPRHLLLDVTGISHLFGGEQAMLDRIRSSLKAQGFALRGALAGTAAAARALARYRDGTVIACGQEEQAMNPLPVEALNLDGVATHALRRAGLKTVGQVAGRKRSELVARLGSATLAILDEALRGAAKPITPRRPPPEYWREQNFAEPVTNEEVIQASLASLTLSLGKIMERHGQGARRLEATFFRADGAVRRIFIEVGAPTREPTIITRLFHEKLAMLSDPLDPGFGFDLIRLSITHVERVGSETPDFTARANEKVEIGFLIDRLATRFGSHRIRKFQPRDTHIPEEAWVAVPAQHARPSELPWTKTRKTKDVPRRPLRLFARPEPVGLARAQCFVWRKAHHVVAQREGPERIAMEWWHHETSQLPRDYFRMEDGEGRRYWLYSQGTPPQWFMHGILA
ncbi:MAG: DNA polymerase Y family protein [Aestuariivirga sp.]